MSNKSLPSIVSCDTTSNKNRGLYDGWAANYEKDIREWGYVLPEIVAQVLNDQRHKLVQGSENEMPRKTRILDAGAGDGLSGVALREAGWDKESAYIAGNDISPEMLSIAKERKCYDDIKVVDLNKALPYSTDEFDVITCIGSLTYIDPKSGLLEEFVRITRPGGFICYTNRTDKLDDWEEAELHLEEKLSWRLAIEPIGPLPYLPLNKEYGNEIKVVIFLYQVPLNDSVVFNP